MAQTPDIPGEAANLLVQIMERNHETTQAGLDWLRESRNKALDELAENIRAISAALQVEAAELRPLVLPALDYRYDLLDIAKRIEDLKSDI